MNTQTERRKHLEFALSSIMKPGHIMEFGVGSGRSLEWIIRFTQKRVFGFDSFEGLPEDWILSNEKTYTRGSFKYEQPNYDEATLYVGLFEDTIPTWKQEHPGGIAFIHIDSDLYTSCKTVLTQLNDRITPGTILCLDDMYYSRTYDFWQDGEYRAFNEWKTEYNRETHELGTGAGGQVSFRVLQ